MLETVSEILHSSSKFKCSSIPFVSADTPYRRHLIRLWLRDPEFAWQTPKALQQRWAGVYDGVTPERSVFPLEPRIRSASGGQKGKLQ